jgi:hypothetical protein
VKTTESTTSILLMIRLVADAINVEAVERPMIRIRSSDDEGVVALSHDEPVSAIERTA